MKHIRFYEELHDKNRAAERSQGNVIAVFTEGYSVWNRAAEYECLSAVFDWPDSDVNFGGVPVAHLRRKCRRISEAKAREIHPRLFARLDLAEEDFYQEHAEQMERMWA